MNHGRIGLGLIGLTALLGIGAGAQDQSGVTTPIAGLFQEVAAHNELMTNLEYLSDSVGSRLTGSAGLQRAAAWAVNVFGRSHADSVHLEEWRIARAWERGAADARIVSPVSRHITVASSGWSPSTNGIARGPLTFVPAQRLEDLHAYEGHLKGAIVIYQEPVSLSPRPPVMGSPTPPVQAPAPMPDRSVPSPETTFNTARMAFFKKEGVIGVLRDSNQLYGLLTMTSVSGPTFEVGAVPTAMTTHEDYLLVWRLLQRGPVELELSLHNAFSDGPVQVANVIADIRGAEKPDEVVILSAHLDSWDLASGTTDDGVGVVAVMEAARALRALNVTPRRTIRFVLFSGEEQGSVGSRAYVQRHRAELDKISAVLEDDTGTPRILTIGLHQNYAARPIVDTVLASLRPLRLLEPRMERHYGSDYASFNDVGVPGFSCIGDESDYNETHHTQVDTFDKARADGLVQAAQFLAGWAYRVAQLPGLLPRNHD